MALLSNSRSCKVLLAFEMFFVILISAFHALSPIRALTFRMIFLSRFHAIFLFSYFQ